MLISTYFKRKLKNNNKMEKETSKQKMANLIQSYEQVFTIARSMYEDDKLKDWARGTHLIPNLSKQTEVKKN